MSVLAPVYSIEKPFPPEQGYSPVYISPILCDRTTSLQSGSITLYEVFISSVHKYSKYPYLGTRRVKSNGILGAYRWKTYSEIYSLSNRFTSGLKRLKLLPKDLTSIAAYAKNREELILVETACMAQNITIIPLSDSLTCEALGSILSQSKPSLIACGKAQFDTLISLKSTYLNSIRTIIMFDIVRDSIKLHARSLGFDIHEFAEIMELGTEPCEDVPPTPESVYCVSYTSGITGEPKGVMLTHRNLITAIKAVETGGYGFSSKDTYLMYLPHAHIFDRIMFHILTNAGARIGFFSGDIMNIKDDLHRLKPSVFISVPRLYNRFYQIIKQKFQDKTGISKKLLESSLNRKKVKYERSGSIENGMLQSLVFKNVRNALGGKVRLMISGSAPLSGDVLKFLRIVFACPIIEGYGLTETCAASFLTSFSDLTTDHIGGPLPGIEVKLREIHEIEYMCKEGSHIGELCIRSPSVFIGYYNGQEYTDRTIDSDGWFYTGDIVTRNSNDGSFKVIDRLNNIIKLSQGEYVSLEKIETVLLKSKFVHQIFVYGDPFKFYLVAVVVPSKEYLTKRWTKVNNCGKDWNQILKNPKLKNDIFENLKEISIKNQLNRYELVNKIYLESDEWTDQDLLAPTQKLSRNKAKLKYKEVIQQLYAD